MVCEVAHLLQVPHSETADYPNELKSTMLQFFNQVIRKDAVGFLANSLRKIADEVRRQLSWHGVPATLKPFASD